MRRLSSSIYRLAISALTFSRECRGRLPDSLAVGFDLPESFYSRSIYFDVFSHLPASLSLSRSIDVRIPLNIGGGSPFSPIMSISQ